MTISKDSLSKYKYVSFDIFDTLVFRTVPDYTLIYDIVEFLYNTRNNAHLQGFKKRRVAAERYARKSSNKEDIYQDDIYACLPYPADQCMKLKEIEIEVEIANVVGNNPIVELLNWCKDTGKYVVITTDMYLPRSVIKNILTKIGVRYDRLFISSEENATKFTGRLFDLVISKMSINPSDMVHIGDNGISDIIRAKEKGINAIVTPQKLYPNDVYSFNLSNIRRIQIAELVKKSWRPNYADESIYRIGHGVLGPLCVDFCRWIHYIKDRKNLDKLFFLAREGYVIKKIYDVLYPEDRGSTYYIALNRNLLRLPLSTGMDRVGNYFTTLPTRNVFSWNELVDSVSCDVKRKEECLICMQKKYHINQTGIISRTAILEGRYNEPIEFILNWFDNEINEQRYLLQKYLSNIGIQSNSVGLINNSVNGSGQNLLEIFLKENAIDSNIHGIQFIDSQKCRLRLKDRYSTYFDFCGKCDYHKFNMARNSLVFEHLLYEASGTAIRFKSKDGNVEVVCEEQRKEKINNRVIEHIQDCAINYAIMTKNNLDLGPIGYGADLLYNIINSPIKADALTIGSLYDDDYDNDELIIPFPDNIGERSFSDLLKKSKWAEGVYAYYDNPILAVLKHKTKQFLRYIKYKLS